MNSRLTLQKARRLTVALLAVFVAALFASMLEYSGGSWTDGASRGFSWSRNFFCDLLRSRAIDGNPNEWGQRFAIVAFAALGLALFPFWWVAASMLPPRRGALVLGAGSASAVGLALLSVLPSDRFPVLHGVVALTTAGLGLAAALASLLPRFEGEPRASVRRLSGAAAFVSSVLHAGLYVHVAYAGGAETVAEPALQKFAALALLVWMLATLRAASLVSSQRTSYGSLQ